MPVPHIPPGGIHAPFAAQLDEAIEDQLYKPLELRLAEPASTLPKSGVGANCCCGTACIQFLGCNGTPLSGVVVKIYDRQGGNLLAGPLTSDASGNVCPGLGTYKILWVDPTNGGSYSFPLNLYSWSATNIRWGPSGKLVWSPNPIAGYGCCQSINFPLPTTLYLTVCGQTFTLLAGVSNNQIVSWAPAGAVANITTAGVAVVTSCNLGGWDGVTTSTQTVPWAVRINCPSNTTTAAAFAGVCGIGHFNAGIGGFDAYAICPASCTGVGNAYTCCNGGVAPNAGVPFTLTGTIGASISLTGTMPGGMSPSCVFPPASPWPLPCAGDTITVTN